MAKKLGLALGSGAGRGYSHIGVLQVLEENQIPIHCIAGCSMGALVGALYVTGCDVHFIEKFARSFSIKDHVDISLRSGGVVKGSKLKELLRMLTKDRSIEDTDIPFACTAVDYGSGTLTTFTEGSIAEAVRASVSMPGIFSPAEYNGRYYIDGAILELIPANAAWDLGAEVVVGVDASAQWRDLCKKPTSVVGTLMSVMQIYELRLKRLADSNCDLMLIPNVTDISPNFTKDSLRSIDEGRKCAEAALDDIRRLIEL